MSAAQMREKFFDCAAHAQVERPTAEKIAAMLDKLGDQPSLAGFLAAAAQSLTAYCSASLRTSARAVPWASAINAQRLGIELDADEAQAGDCGLDLDAGHRLVEIGHAKR